MEFEAKTSMVLKHILYILLGENSFCGPQKAKCPAEKRKREEDHFAT